MGIKSVRYLFIDDKKTLFYISLTEKTALCLHMAEDRVVHGPGGAAMGTQTKAVAVVAVEGTQMKNIITSLSLLLSAIRVPEKVARCINLSKA